MLTGRNVTQVSLAAGSKLAGEPTNDLAFVGRSARKAVAPLLRPSPASLPPHPFRQPCARPPLAPRDGSGKALVPCAVAQPDRGNRPPWRPARALVARPLAHLPAPNAAHASLGSDADRSWADRAAPYRVPPRRHAGGQRDVRVRGCLCPRHPEPVAAASAGRISASGASRGRMEPRVHRAS